MEAPDPFAKSKALRAELSGLRVKAELNHGRWANGKCLFAPPCASCEVLEQIDGLVALLDQEIARGESPWFPEEKGFKFVLDGS